LWVKPSDLRNDPWFRKNKMMGLSEGERISMIRSAVLIQYTRDGQTDRRTDGIGVAYTCYSTYAVARKNQHNWQQLIMLALQIDVFSIKRSCDTRLWVNSCTALHRHLHGGRNTLCKHTFCVTHQHIKTHPLSTMTTTSTITSVFYLTSSILDCALQGGHSLHQIP